MADDAVTQLKVACDNAYDRFPDSCSNSVWQVIRARVDPNATYMQANALIDDMTSKWKAVTVDDGYDLAQQGIVVVGGLKGTEHGHVIVVYPGEKIESGGYDYPYKGKTLNMRTHGKFPRCMSTSIGPWPGAMSKGDKTVWDPWASDTIFKTVQFWTPPAAS